MRLAAIVWGACLLATARAEMPLSRHVIASVREDKLPPVVTRFTDDLDRAREGKHLPPKLRAQLSFPLTLRETSYEVTGTTCLRHYKESQVKDAAGLWESLKRLGEAFHNDPIRNLGEGTYGIATEASCSHIWSVQFDEKRARAKEITVDAIN